MGTGPSPAMSAQLTPLLWGRAGGKRNWGDLEAQSSEQRLGTAQAKAAPNTQEKGTHPHSLCQPCPMVTGSPACPSSLTAGPGAALGSLLQEVLDEDIARGQPVVSGVVAGGVHHGHAGTGADQHLHGVHAAALAGQHQRCPGHGESAGEEGTIPAAAAAPGAAAPPALQVPAVDGGPAVQQVPAQLRVAHLGSQDQRRGAVLGTQGGG